MLPVGGGLTLYSSKYNSIHQRSHDIYRDLLQSQFCRNCEKQQSLLSLPKMVLATVYHRIDSPRPPKCLLEHKDLDLNLIARFIIIQQFIWYFHGICCLIMLVLPLSQSAVTLKKSIRETKKTKGKTYGLQSLGQQVVVGFFKYVRSKGNPKSVYN